VPSSAPFPAEARATPLLLVLTTVPNDQVAEQLTRTLLDERLVACVNIVPGLRSLYHWQGKLEDEHELLLIMKTQPARYAELEQRIQQLHPYEVCEVLALHAADVANAYLAWVLRETGRP
jgi:periplasmic divalent cation tolerance protein